VGDWSLRNESKKTDTGRSQTKEILESEEEAETSNIEESSSSEGTKVAYFTFLGTAGCYTWYNGWGSDGYRKAEI
jgi:hypothetical protein